MIKYSCHFTAVLLLLSTLSHQTSAQPVIDPDAQVVHLRKDCLSQGTTFVDNCFESTTDLTNWLWGSSGTLRNNQPAPDDRVHVHVGPGDFEPFECPGQLSDVERKGWVSLHGAGREASRFIRNGEIKTGIHGSSLAGACRGAMQLEHCDGLEFSNLAAIGQTAAFWLGTGKGTWNNVDIIGEERGCNAIVVLGWYDLDDGASEKSLQYLFGSRVWVRSSGFWNIALDAISSEIWFYGGDIAVLDVKSTSGLSDALFINEHSDVRLFGTTVRAVGADSNDATGSINGVNIQGGDFHMHGGIISLNANGSTSALTMTGIHSNPIDSEVRVHTPDTAFALIGGTNTISNRLVQQTGTNPSTVRSPFLWQPSDVPPAAGSNSLHGQDVFVDTSANGTNQAHLMVRDDSCAGNGGPWRDMATGNCRVQ